MVDRNICTPQTDHDLDHLDHLHPSLPFWGAVQNLYSTDPAQVTRPTSCRLYAPTRQSELGHTHQGSIFPERSRSSRGNRLSVRAVKLVSRARWISLTTQGSVDVAEWLRWRPAKPLGFARVSSNLIVDGTSFYSRFHPRRFLCRAFLSTDDTKDISHCDAREGATSTLVRTDGTAREHWEGHNLCTCFVLPGIIIH